MRRAARLLVALPVALLAAAPVLARTADGVPVAVVLTSFSAYAVPACVLALALAVLLRAPLAGTVAAAGLLAQSVSLVPLAAGGAAERPGLTVMTSNVRLGSADASDLVRDLTARRVAVLAVQELTPAFAARLDDAGLGSLLPHRVLDPGGGASGTGIYSALPLRREQAWTTTLCGTAASLTHEGRRVVVRNVHPYPPSPSDVDLWTADYAVLQRLAGTSVPRTLVLGDFNATLHHTTLTDLMTTGRWRDAAEVVGAGQVRTWGPARHRPAVLDLDHVLVPRDAGVSSFEVVHLDGSDHRSVVAEVVLRQGR